MSQSDTADTSVFAQHPRLMGVLFMLLVLLTQVGSVAGGNGSVVVGP